jgi:3,4-dihydroxy 2-butanone 4-phosphate synthase/GTP cyclohydrolase II
MLQATDLPKELDSLLSGIKTGRQEHALPWVTLSYAQSLDGSIAAQRSAPLALSGSATLKITHSLRARHSVILIGIGTLLADDPQLNVRLVAGVDPQPVVLDRKLRFPIDARLLRGQKSPWIFTTRNAKPEREAALKKAGARVFRSDTEMRSIENILSVLGREGILSVMVEGGAGVITSFLQAHAVDLVVLTIASRLVGGVRGIESLLVDDGPHLDRFGVQRFDEDLLVWGCPRWTSGVK